MGIFPHISFLLISLVGLFSPGFAWSANIIFVHLGHNIPSCIFTTMKQARALNPDENIYLLTDNKDFQETRSEFFTEENIALVDMNLIPRTKEHQKFSEVNTIDSSISEGFWVYATERFFTLLDFIRDQNLEEVVHLESDSMLYVELDEILPLLKQYDIRLAAPFQSLKGCIPCFVFIKDQRSLTLLIDHILSEVSEYQGTKPHIGANDMQTLASFYKKFGKDFMTPLPTLMPEYGRYYTKRKSLFPQDNTTPLSFLSINAHLFPEYIFDAAGLGIFLNGNDRKHSPQSGPGTIHARCLFDPSRFSYYFKKGAKEREVPYLSFKGKSYRIVNLHFHSKMPEEYTSF